MTVPPPDTRLFPAARTDSPEHTTSGWQRRFMAINIADYIRNVPDFPVAGVQFKDITSLLLSPAAFSDTIDQMVAHAEASNFDCLAAIDSRGFLFAAPMAVRMQLPLLLIRKAGKLPGETLEFDYSLEYGNSTLEIHTGDITPGHRVLIIDDLLATGGSLKAAASLIEKAGGITASIGVVIELIGLGGRDALSGYNFFSLVSFEVDE